VVEVVPAVVALVVPAVVLLVVPLVVPDVVPLVVPEVVPAVVPLVVPDVVPFVVEPEVVPLVVAFVLTVPLLAGVGLLSSLLWQDGFNNKAPPKHIIVKTDHTGLVNNFLSLTFIISKFFIFSIHFKLIILISVLRTCHI
jgi:hypothetical protein